MIPWLRLAIAGAALASAAGGGWWVRGAIADKADLARMQDTARTAARRADNAAEASAELEVLRGAIRDRLRAPQPRVVAALAQSCPAVPLGDVVLPADATLRLRIAAGQHDDADAGQPGPPVRPGAADPGR